MDLPFTPSDDVAVLLNALLDRYENRTKNTEHLTARAIKILLTSLQLPTYFSQTDPSPRLIANEQLSQLEQAHLVRLTWLPGEARHLLESVSIPTDNETRSTAHASLYALLQREPISNTRARLEALLLADRFRFSADDWRTHVIHHTLGQLRAGRSPAPFSLTDSAWNIDLLAVLWALSGLEGETPYRVFSVRTFNDSKHFDEIKSAVVRMARLANPEWKALSAEDMLRELNLVPNPTYIHLAGNWQLTTQSGEILSLGGFIPSIGFPAMQVETIQGVAVHAKSVLCIENLTSFHEFLRAPTMPGSEYVLLCLMGNPSPAIRRLLRLIPETVPIHLWSDMDYGGFNILSQLRKYVSPRVRPYLMDIPTFEAYAHLSRPLTRADVYNLKRLCKRPELADVQPVIRHLLHCGLKLEQEAIQA